MSRGQAIRKFKAFGYEVDRQRKHTVLRHPKTGHVVTMTGGDRIGRQVERIYRTFWRRLERGEYPQLEAR